MFFRLSILHSSIDKNDDWINGLINLEIHWNQKLENNIFYGVFKIQINKPTIFVLRHPPFLFTLWWTNIAIENGHL